MKTRVLRAFIAEQILRRIAPHIDVAVVMPDGKILGPKKDYLPVMTIKSNKFFERLGQDMKIGLGESYTAGEWTASPSLVEVFTPFAEKLDRIVPAWMRSLRKFVEPLQPKHEENHREGARSNISRHYDLSNEMFALFLDETMTYSSANFAGAYPGFDGLAAAQIRKVDGILDFAGVTAGTRLLEIGTGWGQLSLQAAQRGAQVHSITLSKEQKELAEKRIQAAGLSNQVTIELRDYRDITDTYDAVASVEMIEAVGEKYWQTYFDAIASYLKPGGRFGLQAITMQHDRMLAAKHAYGWIHKYIFPGGLIPSLDSIDQNTQATFDLVDRRQMGLDYAHTLKLWRERFMSRSQEVLDLGFDEEFIKIWEYYLAYSEAGFRAHHLDVWQLGFVKK